MMTNTGYEFFFSVACGIGVFISGVELGVLLAITRPPDDPQAEGFRRVAETDGRGARATQGERDAC